MKTVITLLLTLVGTAGWGQVKCHIEGTVAEGTKPVELVIYRCGTQPKDSPYKLTVKDGRFECDIEESEIERYSIADHGEVLETGRTQRTAEFLVENGVTVRLHVHGNEIDVASEGEEHRKWSDMKKAAEAKFRPAVEAIEGDEEAERKLLQEYSLWTKDYFRNKPMLGFLLELDDRLKTFHWNDSSLVTLLDIYHKYYTDVCPGHSVHKRILAEEAKDYQICGRKYRDYNVRTIDGKQVRASDFYRNRLTLVVCLASWCNSCIREANEIKPLYEKYRDRGLNVFSLAHEFKSMDAIRRVVEHNKFPWPCLVDLDDEFGVFKMHGTANQALFVVDCDGTIIAVPYDVGELKAKLEEIFGDK